MDLYPILFQYKWVIIFYSAVVLLIYLNRKKFEVQGKIIAIYRTKFGVKFMQNLGTKYSELIKIFGYMATGTAFVLMFVVVLLFALILYSTLKQFFTTGTATAAVAPFIPGVPIPGSPITPPLFPSLIAVFIVIIVHEASHGIVAAAYKLKIQSSGYAQFGPIPAAFVEPDEKAMKKQPNIVQYSIFSAGIFSNLLMALLFFLMLIFVIAPINNSTLEPHGFSFIGIEPDQPAAHAGLKPGVTYNTINGKTITNNSDFMNMFQCAPPGTTFLVTDENYTYTLVSIPKQGEPQKAYLGIKCYTSSQGSVCMNTSYRIKNGMNPYLLKIFSFIREVIYWVLLISLGLALINLLPCGPFDGGRIFLLASETVFGKDKGKQIWIKSSYIVLLVIFILFLPILIAVLNLIITGLLSLLSLILGFLK